MIKLLIVDDEPLVQIGIKSMLDWNRFGIEICGTAMNGQVALEMMKEYSPQLVITDIRMPIMNGLELAKRCQEEYGKLPLFIILTSYEEFHLVKEALSYQVVDYLIKLELDEKILSESIQRALNQLQELTAASIRQKSSGKPLLQIYHDKFFMRLLHNLFDSEEQFFLQAKDLSLEFSDRCYVASHFEIHEFQTGQLDQAQLFQLYNSSLLMIREILIKHIPCYLISLDRKHFSVIFHLPKSPDDLTSKLSEGIESARTMIHNYFNVWLSAGIGSVVDNPLKICESYQEARQASLLTSKEASIIQFEQVPSDKLHHSFNISLLKGDITKAFEEFDTDILSQTLNEIIELFSAYPLRYLQAIDGACNILYLAISLLPDGEQTLSELFISYSDGYRSVYRLTNVEQVVEWMRILRDGLCEVLHSNRKKYKDNVISSVQKYIQNHLEEHVSLNKVAGVFGLSPNYLSLLFKKNCGIGFSEYITQCKIGKAKSLLLKQDNKIYEVAEQLGFESAFYFSKVFKKVEGISPRDYIQQKTELLE